ncbi:EI24 domain-containing protein [Aquabacterium sp.]|uniref:EI24 domain-containing protein n=1 Tax=Aquabacterium sp. TaxID=1872578 RepID=UPI0035B096E9
MSASRMALAVSSFWRALAYCLLPRVVLLSLMPLLLAGGALGGLVWWGWTDAVAGVRALLDHWSLSAHLLSWLDTMGWTHLRSVVAPMVLVLVAVPVVVMVCMLLVSAFMVPAITALVRDRRFPHLQAQHEVTVWQSVLWSAKATLIACLALVLTLPLWLVPMLALLLPPLIWGWLTYRVMAFDVLADWAADGERQQILSEHGRVLLIMGVACGALGAVPGALWAIGALAVVFAPFLMLVSIWLYTLVFALGAAWFAHYLLSALDVVRRDGVAVSAARADLDYSKVET